MTVGNHNPTRGVNMLDRVHMFMVGERETLPGISRIRATHAIDNQGRTGLTMFLCADTALWSTISNTAPFQYPADVVTIVGTVAAHLDPLLTDNFATMVMSEPLTIATLDDNMYETLAIDVTGTGFTVQRLVSRVQPWGLVLLDGNGQYFWYDPTVDDQFIRIVIVPDVEPGELSTTDAERALNISAGWNVTMTDDRSVRDGEVAHMRELFTASTELPDL